MQGKVKWFDDVRGYGFIGFKDNEDIFVHYSAIREGENKHRSLTKDEIVEFDLIKTENGYKAKNVLSIQD